MREQPNDQFQVLSERIHHLEVRLLFCKRTILSLILLTTVALGMGTGRNADIPDYVDVRKGFRVVDREGLLRCILGADERGDPVIHLTDKRGRKRIVLGLDSRDGTCGLSVHGEDGGERGFLGLTEGCNSLLFYDTKGVTRVALGQEGGSGMPGLQISDEKRTPRVMLGQHEQKDGKMAAGLIILDHNRIQRVNLCTYSSGKPLFQLFDMRQDPKINLGITGEPEKALVSMCGKGVDERAIIEVTPRNEVKFTIKDENGQSHDLMKERQWEGR